MPSYGSKSKKMYTLTLLSMCLGEVEVLEVVLHGRWANDLSWGKNYFPGGPGVSGNYRAYP